MGRSHRPRKMAFLERGAFIEEAEEIRTREEWERLRREVEEGLGQVGFDTDIIADLLTSAEVPEMDWWDTPYLEENIVNSLIQRPALLPPPIDMDQLAQPKPLMLTTEEHKKIRRQRRLAEQKEKQEQIKLGLLPPEPPKVRIANIARILGTQSVQEPSRVEAEIRAQAMQRHQAHLEANLTRQQEAQQTAAAKSHLRQQQSIEMVNVPRVVFKVGNLDPPQWKFKVFKNAQQLELTGCIIYYAGCNLIIAEGKAASVRRYKKLLMERINWSVAPEGYDGDVDENCCRLIWEGNVAERAFYRFEGKTMESELDAKEYLERRGLEHYWKLAK